MPWSIEHFVERKPLIYEECSVEKQTNKQLQFHCTTYKSFASAGPAFKTSEMAILGSPLVKWGLSRPPLTAMPNP